MAAVLLAASAAGRAQTIADLQKGRLNFTGGFLAATRILRGVLDAPRPDRQVYLAKVNDLAAKYETLVHRATTTAKNQTVRLHISAFFRRNRTPLPLSH